jgi:hypothetical protein
MNNELHSVTNGATVTMEKIGPIEAQDLLDNHNPRNRTLTPKTLGKYMRAIEAGDWPFVGDPIRLDVDGNLIDGQHRLRAIVETGATLEFLIIRGLATDTQRYMDAGRNRSAADQLKIEGMTAAPLAASIATCAMRWERGDILAQYLKFSPFEVVDWTESHLDLVEAAVVTAQRVRAAIGATPSIIGGAFIEGLHAAPDQGPPFFEGLITGAELEPGSPVLALRDSISRGKRDRTLYRTTELFYVVKAWNHWRLGKNISKLQLPRGSEVKASHMIMK